MKTFVTIFAICILLAPDASAQKKAKITDADQIKAVIEKESKAFFSIDYDTWMKSWVHTPSAYWSYADNSGINYYEGWKAIEIGFTDYFVTSKPTEFEIERTYEDLKVYGKGAFARFKQRIITNGVKGPEQVEIRLLEKEGDEWKILLVGVLKKST
jgi:hypothetical protein